MEFQPNNQYYYAGMQQNPQVATRFENALTAEEIESLQKKTSQFSIAITHEEQLRGICNHRTLDGMQDALVEDPMTGNMRCQICGYEFKPVDPSVSIEDIKDSVQVINNILQTIKLLYIDLPPEAARDYFQIIPLINKIPELFTFAAKCFNKHELGSQWAMNRNPGIINMFNNLTNLFGGGMMMQQPQAQGFGQPNQAMNQPAGYPSYPQGFGQPNPMMGQPMSNGFGFVNQGQYQPQMAGYQYNPGQTSPATPTVNPTVAPAQEAPATDTVTTTVKA